MRAQRFIALLPVAALVLLTIACATHEPLGQPDGMPRVEPVPPMWSSAQLEATVLGVVEAAVCERQIMLHDDVYSIDRMYGFICLNADGNWQLRAYADERASTVALSSWSPLSDEGVLAVGGGWFAIGHASLLQSLERAGMIFEMREDLPARVELPISDDQLNMCVSFVTIASAQIIQGVLGAEDYLTDLERTALPGVDEIVEDIVSNVSLDDSFWSDPYLDVVIESAISAEIWKGKKYCREASISQGG